ncbi:DUF3575 domain-containing protein [Flavobacterium gyeonganense]|uniref:DUF3575 domain-containing protein n=1 Tax=Flavobacterium gyeonganense TaxID=1310418 RepID=A0ABV5HFA2_9FLAO|nr:DUF3575 domain-containing protein [Flavobacterium gyeonganense]
MKKILIILFILSISVKGQTYIKFNTFSALVLVPNLGLETSIGKKTTFSLDVMASFWESFDGKKPMKFITYTPEIRYNFKEKYNGFYTGGHIGFDTYEIQKWDYWKDFPNHYEKGMGYRIGATIGYNKKLNEKFLLDLFVRGGWHQGFYKGHYNDGTPGSYENVKNWNKSGEWLPYGGGIMISYKLN